MGNQSYAHWAVNLAASVKFYSPLHITLLHDGLYDKIPVEERVVFDTIVKVNPEHYTGKDGRFQPGKAKLYLNEYFSHKQNIFIDADSILIDGIEKLFDECKDKDVAIQSYATVTNESKGWACEWADWDMLPKLFDMPKEFTLYELNSSFIYAKKNKKAADFFKQAQANFLDDYQTKWGTKFPDELAFDVATAQTGLDVSYGSDHYPVAMTSKIDGLVLGITKLKDHTPIMSFWGGLNANLASHYRNLEGAAHKVHKAIFNKQNPYKAHKLMKSKLIHKEGVRLIKNKRA